MLRRNPGFMMPPGFKFTHKADVLLPRAIDVQEALRSDSEGGVSLGNIIGRLKPGFTPEQAQSELNSILQRLKQENPRRQFVERAVVTPLAEKLFGNLRLGLLSQF
jgi:F420-0:gamma-glutamyl ligase-like protein